MSDKVKLGAGVIAGVRAAAVTAALALSVAGSLSAVEAGGAANPWWIGERTADELGWGEWTMDLDVAREKVAAEGGAARVLVYVGGELWCPNCFNVSTNLLEKEEFVAWARDNKIACAYIDQANKDKDDKWLEWETAMGSMLTRNPARNGASGAAYLAAHDVPDEDAKAVYARNMSLSTETWLLPSSTAVRLGNPTFLMLMPDGTVACRVNNREEFGTLEENLARFDLARKLTDESSTEPAWTKLAFGANSTNAVTLQVNAAKMYARLVGAVPGRLDAAFDLETGASAPSVKLYSGAPGALTELAGEGSAFSCTLTSEACAAGLWIGLESFADSGSVLYGAENMELSGTLALSLDAVGSVAFSSGAVYARELDGIGSVKLSRTGGTAGAVDVRVSLKGSAAGNGARYQWTDQVVSWADGEDGEKVVSFALADDGVQQGRESFVLALSAEAGTDPAVLVGDVECAVTVDDAKNAQLEFAEYVLEAYKGFELYAEFPVVNLSKGRAKAKILEGSLPSGVKVRLDADAGVLIVKGVPKRTGTSAATCAVSVRQDRKTAEGQPSRIVVVVRAPSSKESMGSAATNAFTGRTVRSFAMPLYEDLEGATRVAGVLSVAQTVSGRVSARYSGISGKASFSGRWSGYDTVSGTASGAFIKGNSSCRLAMTASGGFSASVFDATRGAKLFTIGEVRPIGDVTPYVGRYTVTLPIAAGTGSRIASGTAWLTMSVAANGKAKYKGLAPNGTAVGGSVRLLADAAGTAVVPVFVAKGKGKTFLGAALSLLPDAKSEYESGNPEIIAAYGGTAASWSFTRGAVSETSLLEVYGGFFEKDFDLHTCCDEKYATTVFSASFDLSRLPPDVKVYSIAEGMVKVSGNGFGVLSFDEGFTFKYKSADGTVKGNTKIVDMNAKRLSCKFRGVILPGWTDCGCSAVPPPERPLASGTAFFTLARSGSAVKFSVPVDLKPVY